MRVLAGVSLSAAGSRLLPACGNPLAQEQRAARAVRIGYLAPGFPSLLVDEFREGLRQLGYIEGHNTAIEYRYAGGLDTRLPELAADLLQRNVDVIVVSGGQAALAAKNATQTVPIVMASAGDPVGMGLAGSLARPGGNVTGLTSLSSVLGSKRLEILQQLVPGVIRVAVFVSSEPGVKVLQLRETQAAARALGLMISPLEARGSGNLDLVFASVMADHADAILTFGEDVTANQMRRIVDFTARNRLPAMYELRDFVDFGGLMAYGPSLPALYRRAATYVDKILKGTRPGDLPVEKPARFELVVNARTAQTLGLTIPPTVLAQLDEVVQ